MRRIIYPGLLAALFFAGPINAQNDTALVTDIVATPNYFLVVLFGVMLAIGFQFLLTSLSVAIGVSAIPDLKKTYAHARFGSGDNNSGNDDWNDTDSSAATGVVISSALGIWNVITAAISLFGATALALTLTPVVTTTIAITLGLTIWAVFYLLMFYLEGRMVGTAIGGLINTAVSGLRAGGEAVKSMFAPSPATQVQNVADTTIEKLRQEMSATFDTDGIADAINNFTNKVDKKLDHPLGNIPSYDKLKADLKEVVNSGGNQSNPAKWTAIQSALQSAIDNGEGDEDSDDQGSDDKIAQLKELLQEAKSATSGSGSGTSNGDNSTIKKYQDQLTGYLETAAPEDFDTDKLTENIQKLSADPKGSAQAIWHQVGEIDENTILDAITKNTGLDKKQLRGYADKVTSALSTIRGKSSQGGSTIVNKATGLLDSLQTGVASFIDGTDDPRLKSADLKGDFTKMFNNPNESPGHHQQAAGFLRSRYARQRINQQFQTKPGRH